MKKDEVALRRLVDDVAGGENTRVTAPADPSTSLFSGTPAATASAPTSLNPEKARPSGSPPQGSAGAARPKKKCAEDPGVIVPVVDRNACEGKKDCVAVCPYGVFEVRRIDDGDFAQLTLLGKVKSAVHGRQTAYTPKSMDCRACGLCVTACPERAIRLVDVSALSARIRSGA